MRVTFNRIVTSASGVARTDLDARLENATTLVCFRQSADGQVFGNLIHATQSREGCRYVQFPPHQADGTSVPRRDHRARHERVWHPRHYRTDGRVSPLASSRMAMGDPGRDSVAPDLAAWRLPHSQNRRGAVRERPAALWPVHDGDKEGTGRRAASGRRTRSTWSHRQRETGGIKQTQRFHCEAD